MEVFRSFNEQDLSMVDEGKVQTLWKDFLSLFIDGAKTDGFARRVPWACWGSFGRLKGTLIHFPIDFPFRTKERAKFDKALLAI